MNNLRHKMEVKSLNADTQCQTRKRTKKDPLIKKRQQMEDDKKKNYR